MRICVFLNTLKNATLHLWHACTNACVCVCVNVSVCVYMSCVFHSPQGDSTMPISEQLRALCRQVEWAVASPKERKGTMHLVLPGIFLSISESNSIWEGFFREHRGSAGGC